VEARLLKIWRCYPEPHALATGTSELDGQIDLLGTTAKGNLHIQTSSVPIGFPKSTEILELEWSSQKLQNGWHCSAELTLVTRLIRLLLHDFNLPEDVHFDLWLFFLGRAETARELVPRDASPVSGSGPARRTTRSISAGRCSPPTW